jgi:hypothetical protein
MAGFLLDGGAKLLGGAGDGGRGGGVRLGGTAAGLLEYEGGDSLKATPLSREAGAQGPSAPFRTRCVG